MNGKSWGRRNPIAFCWLLLAALFLIASDAYLYMPDMPSEPRPETGNVYYVSCGKFMHRYLTKKEAWADRILFGIRLTFWVPIRIVKKRQGLPK